MVDKEKTLKLLDLTRAEELALKVPKGFEDYMTATACKAGTGYIVQSFTDPNLEYMTAIKGFQGGWYGFCTCAGWSSSPDAEAGRVPCKHVMAALLKEPSFMRMKTGATPAPRAAAPASDSDDSPFIEGPKLPPAKAPAPAKRSHKAAASQEAHAAPVVEMKATTLAGKLAEVMAEVGYVQKDATNDFHHYKYASAEAVLRKVNVALSKRGIAVSSHVTMLHHELTTPATAAAVGATRSPDDGKRKLFVVVHIAADFTDGIDSIHAEGLGEASDAGDKALMKANTAALKYLLANAFMISWGDDPEADPSADE
jgi:hypothetical protein